MELVTAEQRRNSSSTGTWPAMPYGRWSRYSRRRATTRLISSMNPQDEDTLYGLWDFGFGYPELGYGRLSDLESTTAPIPPAGIGPERDLHFKPSHSLSADAEAAQKNGAVTDDTRLPDAGPRPPLNCRSNALLETNASSRS